MKSKWLAVGIVLLFVGVTIAPAIAQNTEKSQSSSRGNWLYVGGSGPGNYTNIQGAIDNASNGDTVFVYDDSSPYYEHLNINKSLNLLGEDKNTTIIDGGGEGNDISIVLDWVNISGFTIQNSGTVPYSDDAGIFMNSYYNSITNNIIVNNNYGIYSEDGSNIIIAGNNISQNSYGIVGDFCSNIIITRNNIWYNWVGLWDPLISKNYTISENIFSSNLNYALYLHSLDDSEIKGNSVSDDMGIGISISRIHSTTIVDNLLINTGIYLSNAVGNVICNNTISSHSHGIRIKEDSDSSCNNIISNNSFFNTGLFISTHNIVINNTVNGKPLVYEYDESNLILDVDAGQIILLNCTNITVKNKKICNTSVGIVIYGSNRCIISGNTIAENNEDGIYLNGLNNTITDNILTNSNIGVLLSYSDYNTIKNNTITDNHNVQGTGIYLYDKSSYNNIINNTITNNDEGMTLSSTDNNNIIENTITGNYRDGIFLSGHNNTVTNNLIANNDYGITLSLSDHNNLINNKITNNRCGINSIGLSFDKNTNNTISQNYITNNDDGICLNFSDNTTIINNKILNNGNGINLSDSNTNKIASNNISKNRQGIYLVSSTKNTILKNNYLNNQHDAFFNKSKKTTWDQNYWNKPRIFPKLIFGRTKLAFFEFLSINIDWHPAQKPYDTGE